MAVRNEHKPLEDKNLDEPKIAMSFHRHKYWYYGAVYLLIIFILYANF